MGICRRAWLLAALATSVVMAGPFDFVKVVDSEDLTYAEFNAPAYNNNGTVAFWAMDLATGSGGIHTGSLGGPTTTIATTGSDIVDFGGGWVALNSQDKVAFWALHSDNNESIFYGNQGGLTTVYDKTMSTPGYGTIAQVGPTVDINDSGWATFRNLYAPDQMVVHSWQNGTLSNLIATSPGYYGFQPYTSINNSGTVAAWAHSTQGPWYTGAKQIVRLDGGGVEVIAQDSVDPSGLRRLGELPQINNLGEVAWWGEIGAAGSITIFKTDSNGVTTTLLTVPDAIDRYFAFNDLGTVAYIDEVTGGLFYNGPTGKTEILLPGEYVEGKKVDSIQINPESLNDLDQIAIYATFQDGTRGIYVAGLSSAVPEPASLLFLLTGALMWRRRRR